MTSASILPPSLPVSVDLLQCLEQFSRHTQLIFDDLSRSSVQQQQSSSTAGSRVDGLPYATSLSSLHELSAVDEKLAEILHRAQTHAHNQKRIEELEDALLQHEIEWRREIKQLETDRKALKAIVDRGKKDKEAIEQARKGENLIREAHVALEKRTERLPCSRFEAINHPVIRPSTGSLHICSTTA